MRHESCQGMVGSATTSQTKLQKLLDAMVQNDQYRELIYPGRPGQSCLSDNSSPGYPYAACLVLWTHQKQWSIGSKSRHNSWAIKMYRHCRARIAYMVWSRCIWDSSPEQHHLNSAQSKWGGLQNRCYSTQRTHRMTTQNSLPGHQNIAIQQ
jgi:hypothetical protein